MHTLAAAALALAAGCGVPREAYLAKEGEADKYRKLFEQESEKTADFTRKLGELGARVTLLEEESRQLSERVHASEENLAAKQADLRAAQQRAEALQALVDHLATSRARLERAQAEAEQRSAEYQRLAASLGEEIQAGRVALSELRGRTTVQLGERILFPSGSATLDESGRQALRKVAAALRGIRGKVVRVEGHTDDVPVAPGGPYASNWELSSARAIAVVRALQEDGVDPTLLAAAGYGEFQPIAPNSTPEGRGRNRRIEIVLAPPDGAPLPGAPLPAVPSPARRTQRSRRAPAAAPAAPAPRP